MQTKKASVFDCGEHQGETTASGGKDLCSEITRTVSKYARRKAIACQIGAAVPDSDVMFSLLECGRYLLFRHNDFSGLELACGNYCNKHLLCPCCSAARSRRLLAKWLPQVFKHKHVKHFMLTLTWPPPADGAQVAAGGPRAAAGLGGDLKANLDVGLKGWGKLWARRKMRRKGPFTGVLGAIVSVEITLGPSGSWHPHLHCLVSMPRNVTVDVIELREEWSKLTGGRQIRLDRLKAESDVVECFKYAMKPADLVQGKIDPAGIAARYHVYQTMKGRRFIRGYGCYFGVKEPDLEQSETLDEVAEWMDLLYRWNFGRNEYDLVRRTACADLKGGDFK